MRWRRLIVERMKRVYIHPKEDTIADSMRQKRNLRDIE